MDDRATDRSTYDAIAEPVCDLARIIQPAPMLQNRLIAMRVALAKREGEISGGADAHFRLKEQID